MIECIRCPPIDIHWTVYLNSVLTPLIAIIVAYIAWRQWETAKEKIKLDLFDRRFSVYNAVRECLLLSVTRAELSSDEKYNYSVGVLGSKWLFNDAIFNYLNKDLGGSVLELYGLGPALSGNPIFDEQTRARRYELVGLLNEQLMMLDKKFEKFMQLKH